MESAVSKTYNQSREFNRNDLKNIKGSKNYWNVWCLLSVYIFSTAQALKTYCQFIFHNYSSSLLQSHSTSLVHDHHIRYSFSSSWKSCYKG